MSETRIACIGECMVELRERSDGSMWRGYGGDTLNTAVYLARLGVAVDYVTALGDDAWSDEMLASWSAEGVRVEHVHRLPGRLPGLYVIQTDPSGERRFMHWRDSAPARLLFDHADVEALAVFDVVYLSGVTLSIYAEAARETLFRMLLTLKARGGRVAFDTNFRVRGWPDRHAAELAYERMFGLSDVVLASEEDLRLLFGESGSSRLIRHAADTEIVLKTDRLGSRLLHDGRMVEVKTARAAQVVDTTAAGDSFAAAYLAARLRGASPEFAAAAGHELASLVVGHPGAIMPRDAMACLSTEQREETSLKRL